MKSVHNFFKEYAKLSLSGNPKAIAGFYAESFIAAGPKGSMTFNNDARFIKWLKQLHESNKETGMKEMKAVKVTSKPIGAFYTNAKVTWSASFKKTGNEQIKFDISYFLYHSENEFKIIMYISHEDQEDVMKEKGL